MTGRCVAVARPSERISRPEKNAQFAAAAVWKQKSSEQRRSLTSRLRGVEFLFFGGAKAAAEEVHEAADDHFMERQPSFPRVSARMSRTSLPGHEGAAKDDGQTVSRELEAEQGDSAFRAGCARPVSRSEKLR